MVQNPPQGAVLVVNAQGGLYLRVSPSVQANWQAAMPQGAQVIATGNESNGFAEVLYKDVIKGWASEQFLDLVQVQQIAQQVQQAIANVIQPNAPQIEPKSIMSGLKLTITGQDVALRSAPAISVPPFDKGSNVLFLTNKGETATTIGPMQNGFTMVSVRGQEGWLSTQYLSDQPPALARPQPAPQQPAITVGVTPQPKPSGVSGSAGFVLGLGILVAVGYFMMK